MTAFAMRNAISTTTAAQDAGRGSSPSGGGGTGLPFISRHLSMRSERRR